MKVIWKYSIGPRSCVDVLMPKGAEVLHADVQDKEFYFWALVDPRAEQEPRHFMIVPTGGSGIDGLLVENHISTVMDGRYVWHFFEVEEK